MRGNFTSRRIGFVRAGLIACTVAGIALPMTYQVADAQIKIIDPEAAGIEADPRSRT
jgi:hypothetical protein